LVLLVGLLSPFGCDDAPSNDGCPEYPTLTSCDETLPCSKEGATCSWNDDEIIAQCHNGSLQFTHWENIGGSLPVCGADLAVDAAIDLSTVD
jgi:hypothetical protein